ncbi:unnamed protein product [Moneuplotes crassus]|uniref:Uncharacterized protein n=1 Tax=Euplotes crassus TaxID=5936 RepID=A0AAD1XTT5_EUPCR|nr:unnamed protein product [Moneuplotes crassus]
MIYNSFCLFKRRKWCRKKYINSQIYNKGFKKYSLDTDICNIISVCHQSKLLIEWLLDERQIFLSKFGNKSSLSYIDEDLRNPLKDIIKYKCKNFYEKEEQFNHKNEEFVKKISMEGVRDFDRFLINQIEPMSDPKHRRNEISEENKGNPAPDNQSAGYKPVGPTCPPLKATLSQAQLGKAQRQANITTHFQPPTQPLNVTPTVQLKPTEDKESCEVGDVSIEMSNQRSMVEMLQKQISGTNMYQLNSNSNPYKRKLEENPA